MKSKKSRTQSYVKISSDPDGLAGGNDDKFLAKWVASLPPQTPLATVFYVFHHESHCAREAKRGPCDCNPRFELLDKKEPWDYPPPDFPSAAK